LGNVRSPRVDDVVVGPGPVRDGRATRLNRRGPPAGNGRAARFFFYWVRDKRGLPFEIELGPGLILGMVAAENELIAGLFDDGPAGASWQLRRKALVARRACP